jgi:sulfoxide reductase catalytic subunit YedY
MLMAAGFPLAVRLTHFFDFAFLSLLVRSGIEIEILGAHPKLYWNDHCISGNGVVRVVRLAAETALE